MTLSFCIKQLRHQLNLFYLALSFFSRLPVPASTYYSPVLLNQSGRYFSLVGLVLALILVVSYQGLSVIFSPTITVVLLMIVSLLLTGAFHEDGLADMADGIGGGMTTEQRLAIMKDSRIGTYGACALFMALLLKFFLLLALAQLQLIVPTLLLAYGLSRAVAASLIYDMHYVSDSEHSKSKPLANNQTPQELGLLLLIGVAPLLWFSLIAGVSLLFVLFIFRQWFKRWLISRLNGYTGDCLGAGQQISELIVYLVILAWSSSSALLSTAPVLSGVTSP